MKIAMTLALVAVLAGCGSRNRGVEPVGRVTMFSSGPISSACMASERKARNRQLCGCIQTVANMSLSSGEQTRAAAMFRNADQSETTRRSDSRRDEAFWSRYRGFANRAEASCRGY